MRRERIHLIVVDDENGIVPLLPSDFFDKFDVKSFRTVENLFEFIDSAEFKADNTIGIVDVNLSDSSDMDGIDLVIELAVDGMLFPVVFVSHDMRPDQQERAKKVGSYAYIDKFDISERPDLLLEALSRAEGALFYRKLFQLSEAVEWGQRTMLLVGSLQHELKNMVISINNRTLFLKKSTDLSEIHDVAYKLESNVNDLTSLVDSTFNYIKSGSTSEKCDGIDVISIIYRFIKENHDDGKKIVFSCNEMHLRCDIPKFRFIEILWNLTENAFKYGDDDSDVALTISRVDGFCRVGVRSVGKAIVGSRNIRRLFLIGHRDYSENSKPGQGLGLAIVKACAEMYGGSAIYSNEVINLKSYNTFSVDIPLSSPDCIV